MKMSYSIIFFCILWISGCRVVPVQMARVTQIDSYEQTYRIHNEIEADTVFRKVLGEKNWSIFIAYCGDIIEILKELKNQEIVVQGTIISSMSLNPTNQNLFFIEGFGKYYVIRKTTNEILFSATYTIENNIYSISSIKKDKKLELTIKQKLVRHFYSDKPSYYHDVPLKFRVYLKKIKENVYSFAYEKKHEFLVDGKVVGTLFFKKGKGEKFFDFRGRNFLYNDY